MAKTAANPPLVRGGPRGSTELITNGAVNAGGSGSTAAVIEKSGVVRTSTPGNGPTALAISIAAQSRSDFFTGAV